MEEEDGEAEAEPEGEAETEETKAEGTPGEGTRAWGGVLRHIQVLESTSSWAGEAAVH